MPIFIPLLVWGSVLFTTGTAANSIDNATGGHGKDWIGNSIKNWGDDDSASTTQPQTELAQNFSTQTGGNNGTPVTTQQHPRPRTSEQSLTDTANRASAPEKEQPGNDLMDVLGDLMGDHSGKIGTGAGLASLFGLSKLGLSGGKATISGILLGLGVTYHKEILGFAKRAFGTATDMTGPTNQQSFSPGFVSRNSDGAVIDPRASNSFAALPEPVPS